MVHVTHWKTEISLLFVTCCYKLKADLPGVGRKGSHKTPFAATRRCIKLKADLHGVDRFWVLNFFATSNKQGVAAINLIWT